MQITIATLFPEMIETLFRYSILKKAKDSHCINIDIVNIRNFAHDAYKTVDGRPFGGEHGMILRVDIVDACLTYIKSTSQYAKEDMHIVLTEPAGVRYTQAKARLLSHIRHLVIVCGHYEGVDYRVRRLVDEEISIGDYILTGGEIAAMAICDSVIRLVPGTLRNSDTIDDESFTKPMLEYPQYTRPRIYKRMAVPTVLLSGDHEKIKIWRKKESVKRTKQIRPDLLTKQKDQA